MLYVYWYHQKEKQDFIPSDHGVSLRRLPAIETKHMRKLKADEPIIFLN